jgi:hypothetical protein
MASDTGCAVGAAVAGSAGFLRARVAMRRQQTFRLRMQRSCSSGFMGGVFCKQMIW